LCDRRDAGHLERFRSYPDLRVRVGFSEEELTARIKCGEMQLHKFPLGFVVTEIKQFPEERVLIVQLLGGRDFALWAEEVVSHLRAFAKAHGCVAVEALSRLGLEKHLKPLGYKRKRVLLRDELLP
jgi:hypothetical protein